MLNENMLHRLKNKVDKTDPPRMSTLISVCVGYDVNLGLAEEMLHSLGCSFNNRKVRDNAYRLLLTKCRGKDIEECNEILKELGITGKRSFLGTS